MTDPSPGDKPVFGNDPTEAGSTPAEDASGASSERDGSLPGIAD